VAFFFPGFHRFFAIPETADTSLFVMGFFWDWRSVLAAASFAVTSFLWSALPWFDSVFPFCQLGYLFLSRSFAESFSPTAGFFSAELFYRGRMALKSTFSAH